MQSSENLSLEAAIKMAKTMANKIISVSSTIDATGNSILSKDVKTLIGNCVYAINIAIENFKNNKSSFAEAMDAIEAAKSALGSIILYNISNDDLKKKLDQTISEFNESMDNLRIIMSKVTPLSMENAITFAKKAVQGITLASKMTDPNGVIFLKSDEMQQITNYCIELNAALENFKTNKSDFNTTMDSIVGVLSNIGGYVESKRLEGQFIQAITKFNDSLACLRVSWMKSTSTAAATTPPAMPPETSTPHQLTNVHAGQFHAHNAAAAAAPDARKKWWQLGKPK